MVDMFTFGVSRYVPEFQPIVTASIRPNGTRVSKTIYEYGNFDEFAVYPGLGMVLSSVMREIVHLNSIEIKYYPDRKPYEVSSKKTITDSTTNTSTIIYHNYIIEYNEDGSFYTIDKSITSGILMKKKYVPIGDRELFLFLDDYFMIMAVLVNETQI